MCFINLSCVSWLLWGHFFAIYICLYHSFCQRYLSLRHSLNWLFLFKLLRVIQPTTRSVYDIWKLSCLDILTCFSFMFNMMHTSTDDNSNIDIKSQQVIDIRIWNSAMRVPYCMYIFCASNLAYLENRIILVLFLIGTMSR